MKISIVIPVYNEEDYLPACLDAIAVQTVAPDEIIVVDNNSTDRTAQLAKNYSFVRLIKESRQGTVFARNTGFKAAKYEVLARLDADSRIPPNWVSKITQYLVSHPDAAAVTGPPEFYDIRPAWLLNTSQVLFYQRLQRLLTGSYILWGANMAIRRKAWLTVKSMCVERVGIDEDIDLSLWLHKKGFSIHYLSNLPLRASFQRGRTGIRYTASYLASWPRDYFLHRMYLRAFFISILVGAMVLINLPLSLIRKLTPGG